MEEPTVTDSDSLRVDAIDVWKFYEALDAFEAELRVAVLGRGNLHRLVFAND